MNIPNSILEEKSYTLPLTLSCIVAGLLVLALDFTYPMLVGSGVLYVAFLAIAITARSRFTLWLLTIVYVLFHLIGYLVFEEQVFFRNTSMLKPENADVIVSLARDNMFLMRVIGGIAIVFTAALGNVMLKKSEDFEGYLRNLSITDYLTGAYSRRYLYETLKQRFSDTQRFAEFNFSLIMMDIDHFKKINDTHSHLAGDLALRNLCDCVKGVIRNVDIVARYGGEEFIVVSPNSNIEGAMLLAERIRLAVESMVVVYAGKQIPVTVSLGVADYRTKNYKSLDEMIHAADAALFRAKGAGRNQTQSV